MKIIAKFIAWIYGINHPMPLSAIHNNLKEILNQTKFVDTKLSTRVLVNEIIKLDVGIDCKSCNFSDELKCPYFKTYGEEMFCVSTIEDFVKHLGSRFSLSENDKKEISEGLESIENPLIQVSLKSLEDSKHFRFFADGVLQVTNLRRVVRYNDLGLKKAMEDVIRILREAKPEICFSALAGWWAVQDPFFTILKEKIRKGVKVRVILAKTPVFGYSKVRFETMYEKLKRIGCEIRRVIPPAGRFLQVLIVDHGNCMYYFKDLESNNLYDFSFTNERKDAERLYGEFCTLYNSESLGNLLANELKNIDLAHLLTTDIFKKIAVIIASSFLGGYFAGLWGAILGIFLGFMIGTLFISF